MKLTYPGLFPYSCNYGTKNEDGDPISIWDGSTLCNNVPSARADANISVIGLGTPYPWGFTASEIAYLYWKVNWWKGIKLKIDASSYAVLDYTNWPMQVLYTWPTITISDTDLYVSYPDFDPQTRLICGNIFDLNGLNFNGSPWQDVVDNSFSTNPENRYSFPWGDSILYTGPQPQSWSNPYDDRQFYGYPHQFYQGSYVVAIELKKGFWDSSSKLYYPGINLGASSSASLNWNVTLACDDWGNCSTAGGNVLGPSMSISYDTGYIPLSSSTTITTQEIEFLGLKRDIQVATESSQGDFPGMGSISVSLNVSGISFDKENEWHWG